MCGLLRDDAVAECGELLGEGEVVAGVGDPAGFETHQPFHERRCWARPAGVVHEGGGWGGASGEVFPASDGSGVASPASKSCPISVHRLSGSSGLG